MGWWAIRLIGLGHSMGRTCSPMGWWPPAEFESVVPWGTAASTCHSMRGSYPMNWGPNKARQLKWAPRERVGDVPYVWVNAMHGILCGPAAADLFHWGLGIFKLLLMMR